MQPAVEDLFEQWRRAADHRALAGVFDRVAPELWRVGYHLCGSRSGADDLLQATFLAAMQSAARWRREQPLVPWLLGILTNKLRMQRRRERQLVPARPVMAVADDPVAAAERAELRALLQQRIEQLEEPYRAVLVLQLEHALTPAEIAHVLGRQRATVRSQLQRGFELLRRGLPLGLLGPGAGAVATPDLGAVRRAVLAAAAGGSGAAMLISMGVLCMTKKLVVATVAAAALLAGVWSAWPEPDVAVTAMGVMADAQSVASAPDSPSSGHPWKPGERIEVRATVPAPSGALGVTVRWADGSAAVGMGVSIEPPQQDGGFLAQQWRDTDAAGVVEWRGLVPNTYMVSARHGGEKRVAVGAGATVRLELTIPEGIDLRGVVVDPAGVPVPGATIVLGPMLIGSRSDRLLAAAKADRHGAFDLRSVPENYLVAAVAEGRLASTESRAVELARQVPVCLRLGALAGTVDGRVVDEQGQPVAGAWIAHAAVAAESTLHVVQADALGRFVLLGTRVGSASPLHAGACNKAPWRGTVGVEAGRRSFVEIRLLPACSLRGVVRGDDGRCVAEPEITVVEQDGHTVQAGQRSGWNRPQVKVDDDGGYLVTNLRPGRVRVAIEDRQARCEYLDLDIAPGSRVLDVVLSRPGAIRGNVLDADGAPLVGWSVDATGPPGVRSPKAVVTGPDGGFSIPSCSPAAHVLSCSSRFPGASLRGVVPGGKAVVLRVSRENVPSCFLRGTIAGAEPTRVNVVLDGEPGLGSRVQPGGAFVLGPLPAGRHSLHALLLEVGAELLPVPVPVSLGSFALVPGQDLDVGIVRIPVLGELAVELQNIDGSPVAPGRCALASLDGTRVAAFGRVVDGVEVFRIAPGTYLAHGGFADSCFEQGPIEVRSGERTLVRLRAVAGVPRILRCDFAPGVLLPREGILRKNGVAMRSFSPFVDVPLRFSPGQWELELGFADGRMERFPFVVTGDVEASPIEIRVPR